MSKNIVSSLSKNCKLVYLYLLNFQKATISELSSALKIKPNTVNHILKRLQQKSLVILIKDGKKLLAVITNREVKNLEKSSNFQEKIHKKIQHENRPQTLIKTNGLDWGRKQKIQHKIQVDFQVETSDQESMNTRKTINPKLTIQQAKRKSIVKLNLSGLARITGNYQMLQTWLKALALTRDAQMLRDVVKSFESVKTEILKGFIKHLKERKKERTKERKKENDYLFNILSLKNLTYSYTIYVYGITKRLVYLNYLKKYFNLNKLLSEKFIVENDFEVQEIVKSESKKTDSVIKSIGDIELNLSTARGKKKNHLDNIVLKLREAFPKKQASSVLFVLNDRIQELQKIYPKEDLYGFFDEDFLPKIIPKLKSVRYPDRYLKKVLDSPDLQAKISDWYKEEG